MKSRTCRQEISKVSEILLFGKYKYKTIQYILRTDPSYITWLAEEKIVKFPQEILNDAYDLCLDQLLDEIDSHGHNYSSYYDD